MIKTIPLGTIDISLCLEHNGIYVYLNDDEIPAGNWTIDDLVTDIIECYAIDGFFELGTKEAEVVDQLATALEKAAKTLRNSRRKEEGVIDVDWLGTVGTVQEDGNDLIMTVKPQ
jgi:hypothetical protein